MIQVIRIPAFTDNYIWLITNEARQYGVLVDPGSATPVLAELEQRQIQPLAILITHKHNDHIGGINAIREKYPHIEIYGPANEEIPHRDHALTEGDLVHFDKLDATFQVMDVFGHTAGHIAYHGEASLFCGDTIFGAGCGRVFDGTMEDLHHALHRIAQLPPETLIYCAHEYTLDNLGFAKWVEPDNKDIDERQEDCWELLDSGQATVPFTLEMEFKTNPFLRTHIPEVIAKAEEVAGRELATQAEVFAALRIWKDTEYD